MTEQPRLKPYALAGDIGGTQMRAALVDRDGVLRHKASAETRPRDGFDVATRRFVELLRQASRGVPPGGIAAVGVSSAGPMDTTTGVYYNPPNLHGWDRKTMKPEIAASLRLTTVMGHDARVAAIAEARWGVARGMKNVIYVTVSTGIGGGILVDGRPVNGVQGLAGEMGHIVVDPGGTACNGGCRGCLEVIASGGGVANTARRRIAAGEKTRILELSGGDPERIVGRTVFEAAALGDAMALDLVERAIAALGIVLGGLLNTFAPEILIVGGSVGIEGLRPYWDRLDAAIRSRSLLRYHEKAPLAIAALGDDVGLMGAAAIAFDAAET